MQRLAWQDGVASRFEAAYSLKMAKAKKLSPSLIYLNRSWPWRLARRRRRQAKWRQLKKTTSPRRRNEALFLLYSASKMTDSETENTETVAASNEEMLRASRKKK